MYMNYMSTIKNTENLKRQFSIIIDIYKSDTNAGHIYLTYSR
jgi:hypothetical protein